MEAATTYADSTRVRYRRAFRRRRIVLGAGVALAVTAALGITFAGAKSVRIEDLADEDWLCGALPSSCRDQVLELCRDAGFEPKISFRSEDYEVIKGFVAAGLGVTILPELAGGHPGIELRTVRGRKPIRQVWAVTRENEARSPAAEEMLGILRQVCRTYRDDQALLLAA